MTLYPYEQVTFELFDYLEEELRFDKSFDRIAFESNIVYAKHNIRLSFRYEVGWRYTAIHIERESNIKKIVEEIELEAGHVISEFGKNWLAQNPQSLTNKILKDNYHDINFDNHLLSVEVKRLLYCREHLKNILKF